MFEQKTKNKDTFMAMETNTDLGDIVSYTNELINLAVSTGASDIHIEPNRNFVSVRFRESGDFIYIDKISSDEYTKLLARIKILASLRIDEKFRPQDWKIGYTMDTTWEMLDIRVSLLPIVDWEKVVMRILRQDMSLLNLDKLEFLDINLQKIKETLKSRYWMILVAWPTGSGKSTTLFSVLKHFNPLDLNISTLEDPVEYNIPYINQTQVRPDIGFDFAWGLRTLVRQDPDIIMVWEIRDKETAMLAIEAALTGHLVLSTIHTNSAAGTIQRLINMGVEPFLITSALKLVISQRLIKRICKKCAKPYKITEKALTAKLDTYLDGIIPEKTEAVDFYKWDWCEECTYTWHKWRLWVHEVLVVDERLDDLILNKSSANELEKRATDLGMVTIMQDSILKAATGKTSVEEALKLI
ncbi:MAG: Type II secretion system protein E [uncultured bacterium (gcode 4)]|uniref:Type II secretion system protein E n=1 Tax=uncultured bacterium (gcode 4) TaxID=1234023 RepID=K2G2C2_9BACT|nr:MAG: Type II secretion system protein E [uncultured bacterium (gcode 4)]